MDPRFRSVDLHRFASLTSTSPNNDHAAALEFEDPGETDKVVHAHGEQRFIFEDGIHSNSQKLTLILHPFVVNDIILRSFLAC